MDSNNADIRPNQYPIATKHSIVCLIGNIVNDTLGKVDINHGKWTIPNWMLRYQNNYLNIIKLFNDKELICQ